MTRKGSLGRLFERMQTFVRMDNGRRTMAELEELAPNLTMECQRTATFLQVRTPR
jgi:hypothetical protein